LIAETRYFHRNVVTDAACMLNKMCSTMPTAATTLNLLQDFKCQDQEILGTPRCTFISYSFRNFHVQHQAIR